MLRENPDESRGARGHWVSVLAKWAKYGVLAMIVADAVGIMVVNHRLHQPAVTVPSLADDMPVAMTDTVSAMPKDVLPRDVLAKDNRASVNVSDTVAQMDLQPLPAVARMDPLPAPMKIEPLALDTPQASPKVARQMQAALRAPVIPTVRIAELHSSHKANREFSSAFSRDISVSTQASGTNADVDFAQVRVAREASQQSGTAYSQTGGQIGADPQVSLDAPTQSQDAVPSPTFGGDSKAQQLELPLPQAPAPVAPEASAPASGEIPAS